MRIESREQVKLLLGMRGLNITKLAKLLSDKTGEKYTLPTLSSKLIRGSLSYNEMLTICEILGYEIEFKSLK